MHFVYSLIARSASCASESAHDATTVRSTTDMISIRLRSVGTVLPPSDSVTFRQSIFHRFRITTVFRRLAVLEARLVGKA